MSKTKTKNQPTKRKPEEKRLKRFRSSCPQGILQRIERARTQRLFLITKGEINREALSCDFVVLGSTGNVYDVQIQRLPHCSCPDHAKGNLCKHILFCLLKVMAINPSSPLIYQAAWIGTELEEMFAQMEQRFGQISGSVVANAAVRETFSKLGRDGDDEKVVEDSPGTARRQPLEQDPDCPICFDTMDAASGRLTYCRAQCGANMHQDCMNRWLQQHRQDPTCPMCRQVWDDGTPKKAAVGDEGYANLGRLQGQSPDRDTSSYNPWAFDRRKRRRG